MLNYWRCTKQVRKEVVHGKTVPNGHWPDTSINIFKTFSLTRVNIFKDIWRNIHISLPTISSWIFHLQVGLKISSRSFLDLQQKISKYEEKKIKKRFRGVDDVAGRTIRIATFYGNIINFCAYHRHWRVHGQII